MGSETTLDRFGRVVIPKQTRDRFGLEPGTALMVDEREDGILLKPAQAEPPLRVKGAVLVFAGAVAGEPVETLRRLREERIQRLMQRAKRPKR